MLWRPFIREIVQLAPQLKRISLGGSCLVRQFPAERDSLDGSAEDSPIAKLWYGILGDGLKRGGERIHVFPSGEPPLIRLGQQQEIDELLSDDDIPGPVPTFTVQVFLNDEWEILIQPPAVMYKAFLQRLKFMANFTFAKQVEQGRFRIAVGDAVYELEVTVRVRPDGTQEAMIDLPKAPLSVEHA